MPQYNDKSHIIQHYDVVSPYYHSLWGEHLHHGYWVTGKETKEEAQLSLTKLLAERANIQTGAKILDVGCGFGASSIYLAQHYNAETLGITISPVQVAMANEAAKKANVSSSFELMDAESISLSLSRLFDIVWSIESISHYKNRAKFFNKAIELLKPGGTLAIIDWFKKDNLSDAERSKYIEPIEKGMLVELSTMNDYRTIFQSHGLEITTFEDISKNTAKTWDISLEIIKNKMFWKLALQNGKEFVNFLRSFRAMKAGFASGNFIYGMLVARKT